uniref:Putative secreted protein n=1 Tax=Rhodnius neglectus TaxID=72488 RepID=A0A0P4VMM5_9HEMI
MKLLFIFPSFFFFASVQNVFVDAWSLPARSSWCIYNCGKSAENPPTNTNAELQDSHVSSSSGLETKVGQLSEEVANLVRVVPGMDYIAELGKNSFKKVLEFWKYLSQSIETFLERKDCLIDQLVESGREVESSITAGASNMVQEAVNSGNSVLHSSLVTASDYTNRVLGGVNIVSAISDSFTASIHKIIKLLREMRQILLSPSNFAE